MNHSDYEIKVIAFKLDRLVYDFDPYSYADAIQNPADNIEQIFENLKAGNVENYISWLCGISEQEWDAIGPDYREKADEMYLKIVEFMDIRPSKSSLREAFDWIADSGVSIRL